VLLDEVRLAFLDALEAVGDVEPVSNLVGARVDEIEFCRVGKPRRDQRGCFDSTVTLSQARGSERVELHVIGKASLDGRFVLCRDCLYEFCAKRP